MSGDEPKVVEETQESEWYKQHKNELPPILEPEIRLKWEMPDYARGKYDVLCGYEFTVEEWINPSTYAVGGTPSHPSIVARCITMDSAAHLLRTLREHGEPDMTYFMCPSEIWEVLEN